MKQLLSLLFLILWPTYLAAQMNQAQHPPMKHHYKMPWMQFGDGLRGGKGKATFSPWQYIQLETDFIAKEAQLTLVETNKVLPLLHELKNQIREIDRTVFKLIEDAADNRDLTDRESEEILKEIDRLNEKKRSVEQVYQKKLLNIISPKKLLKVRQADMAFGRKVLSRMFAEKNANKGDKNDKAQK